MKNVKRVISLLLVTLMIGSLCVTNVSALNWICPFCDGTEPGEHCGTCDDSTCSNCGLCYCTSIGSVADDINNQDYPLGFDFMQMAWSEYSEVGNANSNDEHNVEVYVTKGSTYTVTIPKTIILDGDEGKGEYSVSVSGDIDGTKQIVVVPYNATATAALDNKTEFLMLNQAGKPSIKAEVKQEKTVFTCQELVENNGLLAADGTIEAKDLSAGSWSGVFTMHIAYEDKAELNTPAQIGVEYFAYGASGCQGIVFNNDSTITLYMYDYADADTFEVSENPTFNQTIPVTYNEDGTEVIIEGMVYLYIASDGQTLLNVEGQPYAIDRDLAFELFLEFVENKG